MIKSRLLSISPLFIVIFFAYFELIFGIKFHNSTDRVAGLFEDELLPPTGDLNSDDACIHIDQPKNNTCVTWENEVLDYIIPINYPRMKLTRSTTSRTLRIPS